jgi:hypothetical protein
MVLVWGTVVSSRDQLQSAARTSDFFRERDANGTQIWKRQSLLERRYLIKESIANIGCPITKEFRIEAWRLEVHIDENALLSGLCQIPSVIGARKCATNTALV